MSIGNRVTAASLAGMIVAAACGAGTAPPTAPTPTSAPQPVPEPPSATFMLALPIAAGDVANAVGGVNPFGVHLADHGVDGHPGWDLEFRQGANVLAAADGTIQSIVEDPQRPGRFVLQIMHESGSRRFRTVYFGIAAPAPGIVVGAAVRAGTALAPAASLTQMIGTSPVSIASVHFQLDDFAYSGGLTNQNAVSPEAWLTPEARTLFETIWNGAAYMGELTEPFPTNPRDVQFPVTRRWTRQRGDFSDAVELTRATGTTNEYSYRLLDSSGGTLESGVARVTPWTRPFPLIDLVASSGGTRLGLYDAVSGSLRLALAPPGAARPSGLAGESVYGTSR